MSFTLPFHRHILLSIQTTSHQCHHLSNHFILDVHHPDDHSWCQKRISTRRSIRQYPCSFSGNYFHHDHSFTMVSSAFIRSENDDHRHCLRSDWQSYWTGFTLLEDLIERSIISSRFRSSTKFGIDHFGIQNQSWTEFILCCIDSHACHASCFCHHLSNEWICLNKNKHARAEILVVLLLFSRFDMPSKRRGRDKHRPSPLIYLQSSEEKFLQRIESDIRTIPDQTFAKVYSTIIEPEILVTSIQKSKKKKTISKRKRTSRWFHYQRLYGRNLPDMRMFTLGASLFVSSLSTFRVKSTADMIPSPNFSWITSFIGTPYCKRISWNR